MFGLGWTEMLLIGVVALIVVGPKDLPVVFHTLGRLTGRARAMAREFTDAMNDAADQAGLGDVQKTMRAASNPRTYGIETLRDTIDLDRPTPEERAETDAPAAPAASDPKGPET